MQANEKIKQALMTRIEALVARDGAVPIAQIIRECDDIADARGDLVFELSSYKNAVVWPGLSLEMIKALQDLIAARRILPEPALSKIELAEVLSYGEFAPDMPVATSLPEGGFEVPHWMPLLFVQPDPEFVEALAQEERRQARKAAQAKRFQGDEAW
jgi:hypothetical protein